MKGSEFGRLILTLSPSQREAAILKAVEERWLPRWFVDGPWFQVHTRLTVDGRERELLYNVAPDYFAIGEDDDYLRMPMLPATFQSICDRFDCIMPSRRIVNSVWSVSTCRLEPDPISPNTGAVADFIESNRRITNSLAANRCGPTNALVAGDKKDIVVGPDMTTSFVVIYGWHRLDGKPIQGWSGAAHSSNYVDYSHGARFVSRRATINGEPVDLVDVFNDPKLAPLVSDQGPFIPRFPNKSGGTTVPISTVPPVKTPPTERVPPDAPPEETSSGFGVGKAVMVVGVVAGIAAVASGKVRL